MLGLGFKKRHTIGGVGGVRIVLKVVRCEGESKGEGVA